MSASPRSPIPDVPWRAGGGRAVAVHTRDAPAGAVTDLIRAIPSPTDALSFVSGGDGLVGWGRYDSLTVSGPDAADRISAWWAGHCRRFAVTDEVSVPGSGPVVLVSLGFGPDDPSVAIIPRTVMGSRDGRVFTTVIGDGPAALPPVVPLRGHGQVTYQDGVFPVADYIAAVGVAVQRIRSGEVDKVVLARDLVAVTEQPVDERYLLARLAAVYPTCWTFAVDGLVGASPEMLVRRHGRRIDSRVLAGTAWPVAAGEHTAGVVASHLLGSRKDVQEHRYAVDSVADVLRQVTDDVRAPRTPRALPLANLTHLVTDISARLPHHGERGVESPASALALAARLHPTAAVGGTPREAAAQVIRDLEPAPRGRYAAPVGWMDHRGDGEFALALRCARVDGRRVTLMAGCGIVRDSDPQVEAREAQIKMVPIRDALDG